MLDKYDEFTKELVSMAIEMYEKEFYKNERTKEISDQYICLLSNFIDRAGKKRSTRQDMKESDLKTVEQLIQSNLIDGYCFGFMHGIELYKNDKNAEEKKT